MAAKKEFNFIWQHHESFKTFKELVQKQDEFA